jgi:uncharacterized protein (DUF1919 family)
MITITKITSYGEIYFSVNSILNNVEFVIKDKNFDGFVFSSNFIELKPDVNYYVCINSAIVPHLKKSYIVITDDNSNIYNIDFEFPSETLGNFSLIGNSCVVWRTYEMFNNHYNSPTIGNLILDDEEFVKFCENLEFYLNSEINFGESKGNYNFKKQTGSNRIIDLENNIPNDYPISHHFDVEVHWIHTRNRILLFNNGTFFFKELNEDRIPENELYDKWERRADRSKLSDKICLWSSSEMFNIHGDWARKNLIDRFKSLPCRSIFLTERKSESFEDDLHIVKYIDDWEGFHQLQRNKTGGLTWNDQQKNGKIFYDIINEKFLKKR